MRKINELSYKDLKDVCNPNMFKFEKIKEIADTTNLVYGQDRGIKALEFGVNVDLKGYNLYLEGPAGVGKTMYTKKFLQTKALKEKIPNYWCYIYNFDDPNEPIAVSLPAGQGKIFQETMDSFIRNIRRDEIDAVKKDETYTEDTRKQEEQEIQKITDKYTKKVDELLKVKESEIMAI